MMWKWIETLLRIEAVVVMTVCALAIPIVLVLMARDAWKTYRRNRR